MATDLQKKREKEKKVVGLMIDLYCRKHHPADCEKCKELKEYAFQRIDYCPFMEQKTFCSACKVHCYQKEKREEIKKVMRYAGVRMLFHHPILAIAHLIEEKKQRKQGG